MCVPPPLLPSKVIQGEDTWGLGLWSSMRATKTSGITTQGGYFEQGGKKDSKKARHASVFFFSKSPTGVGILQFLVGTPYGTFQQCLNTATLVVTPGKGGGITTFWTTWQHCRTNFCPASYNPQGGEVFPCSGVGWFSPQRAWFVLCGW